MKHIPAHAVDVVIHVRIDPPRTLYPSDHPRIDGDQFEAHTALWAEDGTVTLHERCGVCNYCLRFEGDEIPAWVPEPPKGWRKKVAALDAAMREVK